MQAPRPWLIILAIIALCLITTLHTAAAPLTTFLVTSTGNGHDSDTSDHVCNDGTAHCTSRAALEQAAAEAVPITINFNIPGSGLHTIVNGGGSARSGVVIDGTTQPGFTNTPLIDLSNSELSLSGGNTVRGLIMNNSGQFALVVSGNGSLITASEFGTDPSGTTAQPNLGGIDVVAGSNNQITNNLISGNSDMGIFVTSNSTGTIIQGNLIGTDITGEHALGNYIGVKITNASHTTLGGTTSADRNVISGNQTDGVETTVNATANLIQGNYIGVDLTGKQALGNGGNGVLLNSSGNTVGGSSQGAGNLIAHNHGAGVSITDSTFGHSINNAVLGNSIVSNGSLGITLGGSSTPHSNDPGDSDVGPNNLQNFPVLKSAASTVRVVKGKLNSTPNTTFTLEIFSSKACDSSKYGEGKTLLGEKTVTTNGSGSARFTFASPKKFKVGAALTATATDPLGSTSEFSKCIAGA